MDRRKFMNNSPSSSVGNVETVSLFHCNNTTGTDSKGYASASSRSLSNVTGKFSGGNGGYIQYQSYQWDEVLMSGSWTVDYWIYPRDNFATWACDIFLGGNSSYDAIVRCQTSYSNSTIEFFIGGGNGWSLNGGKASVTNDSWNHIAITYDGKTCKIYSNGSLAQSFSMTISSIPGSLNYFGRGPASSGNNDAKSNSYRDEIRISKGVRWTGNFTPPSSPES